MPEWVPVITVGEGAPPVGRCVSWPKMYAQKAIHQLIAGPLSSPRIPPAEARFEIAVTAPEAAPVAVGVSGLPRHEVTTVQVIWKR